MRSGPPTHGSHTYKEVGMTVTDAITSSTKYIFLLGSPTSHSASPATHTYSFRKLGIDIVYFALDVKPDQLPLVLPALRRLDYCVGCNVTMPCKQAVIPYLDGLSKEAELIQAVNVIKFENGKATGYNTDGPGFMMNLRRHGFTIEGATLTLFGPGGAGRAITASAAIEGMKKINVFARSHGPSYTAFEQLMPRLIEQTGCDVSLHEAEDLDDLKFCIANSDIFINASPVGMGEGATETPIPPDFLTDKLVVGDAVYFPRETQLILDAKANGNLAVPGIGMMLYQAAIGEDIWCGAKMPVEDVERELF